MADPYVGEIRMFAGNFAPRGWAFCDGQLLAVRQNDALFSLFGTIYGGDGRTTFGLPDLRGRLPIHAGTGPGLSPRTLGRQGGEENVTLSVPELPSHTHTFSGMAVAGNQSSPQGNVVAGRSGDSMYVEDTPDTDMSTAAIGSAGGLQSHNNMMPALCVHFIVALYGVYPSRS